MPLPLPSPRPQRPGPAPVQPEPDPLAHPLARVIVRAVLGGHLVERSGDALDVVLRPAMPSVRDALVHELVGLGAEGRWSARHSCNSLRLWVRR